MALFRVFELESGIIKIDGLDTSTLGLRVLRKAVASIPQKPVIMRGDVKANLDPFKEFPEDVLLSAMSHAGLSGTPLDFELEKGGTNLSAGERQLLCFARAFLQVRSAKIVLMDEPTANVDSNTDRVIQEMLRSNFSHCTILTIAHRLTTVLDYDLICVMEDG